MYTTLPVNSGIVQEISAAFSTDIVYWKQLSEMDVHEMVKQIPGFMYDVPVCYSVFSVISQVFIYIKKKLLLARNLSLWFEWCDFFSLLVMLFSGTQMYKVLLIVPEITFPQPSHWDFSGTSTLGGRTSLNRKWLSAVASRGLGGRSSGSKLSLLSVCLTL